MGEKASESRCPVCLIVQRLDSAVEGSKAPARSILPRICASGRTHDSYQTADPAASSPVPRAHTCIPMVYKKTEKRRKYHSSLVWLRLSETSTFFSPVNQSCVVRPRNRTQRLHRFISETPERRSSTRLECRLAFRDECSSCRTWMNLSQVCDAIPGKVCGS